MSLNENHTLANVPANLHRPPNPMPETFTTRLTNM